jgi:hypothetical protein
MSERDVVFPAGRQSLYEKNRYPINSDIRIGEGTSHCTDVQVDQVSARFIPLIRGVQLGRPTSKITPLSGS